MRVSQPDCECPLRDAGRVSNDLEARGIENLGFASLYRVALGAYPLGVSVPGLNVASLLGLSDTRHGQQSRKRNVR